MSLDITTLAKVIPSLRSFQDAAHRARRDMERLQEARARDDDDPDEALEFSESEEEAQAYLEDSLRTYYHALAVGLEGAGLPDAAGSLRATWSQFPPNSLGIPVWNGRHEHSDSPPLQLLDEVMSVLLPLAGDVVEDRELQKLEQLLAATAVIVKAEGIVPKGELDVQNVMHKFLKTFYDGSFAFNPGIRGTLQNFKADCGIGHLKTAIEFKFVDNENEAKEAARGILEDTAGYRGSLDWTRFYAVIYQTGPWVSEHRYREEVRRVGADTWKVVAVVGAGSRPAAKKATRKKAS